MIQNKRNAVICLGHANGTLTMWAPNMGTPLVKMLCHAGPVVAGAIDQQGWYLATSGNDGKVKIWDVRKYQHLFSYRAIHPPSSIQISQLGLLAVGMGSVVQIWKDALRERQKTPYMEHTVPKARVHDLHFVPYDDVLGIGHTAGVSSILVPGSGEPNFDTMEDNPYQTQKQSRETAVHSLLEKLQPDMITLDPDFVGKVDRAPAGILAEERQQETEARNSKRPRREKHKTKGRSAAQKRFVNKQRNIVEQKRNELQEEQHDKFKQDAQKRKRAKQEKLLEPPAGGDAPSALNRFMK